VLFPERRAGTSTLIEGTGAFVGAAGAVPKQTADERAQDGVIVNLVNVPAAQAAKTILGDILGVKYAIDPTIEGKITIQTPQPVAKASGIDLFQSTLRSNNAAIVNANGTYKIVPVDLAPVGAIPHIVGAIPQAGDDPQVGGQLGSGVHVVQLKYVAASEIRRILEPIAPRGGIIRTDEARHTISLSGTSQEIAGMMEAISIFDVDVMKGMSFALVPVRTSEPAGIADELRTIFASEQEGPIPGTVPAEQTARRHTGDLAAAELPHARGRVGAPARQPGRRKPRSSSSPIRSRTGAPRSWSMCCNRCLAARPAAHATAARATWRHSIRRPALRQAGCNKRHRHLDPAMGA
jgi:type II secretory pathway component GspD/PulD (secretin)